MFIRTQTNGDRTYLLLVENARVGGRRIQRVLHRLGRLDELLATGQLDAVLQSLGRFSDKLLVLDAHIAEPQYQGFQKLAAERGQPYSELIREALNQYLRRQETLSRPKKADRKRASTRKRP